MKLFDSMHDIRKAPLVVFIGYDGTEHDAARVLAHSIRNHHGGGYDVYYRSMYIVPLIYDELRLHHGYNRPIDEFGSTQFSLSRFMTIHLAREYQVRRAIFMDCDMLLTKPFDDSIFTKPVNVCKHDYIPTTSLKMGGARQHSYPRKNWSSFMTFDLSQDDLWDEIDLDYICNASPKNLHRFEWVDDEKIGSIPLKWNYLVGETRETREGDRGIYRKDYGLKRNELPSVIHYTLGTPNLPLYNDCEYADLWFNELGGINANLYL